MGIETAVMIGLMVYGAAEQHEARGDAKHANNLRRQAQAHSRSHGDR
mgnify:FL=1